MTGNILLAILILQLADAQSTYHLIENCMPKQDFFFRLIQILKPYILSFTKAEKCMKYIWGSLLDYTFFEISYSRNDLFSNFKTQEFP